MNFCITFTFRNGRLRLHGDSLNDLHHTILWHTLQTQYQRSWPHRLHASGSGTVMGGSRPCTPRTCGFRP
jgi:hypothetical protein